MRSCGGRCEVLAFLTQPCGSFSHVSFKCRLSGMNDPLATAKKHLAKVQAAWGDPTDWEDLSIYGFYCLECAVKAACDHLGISLGKQHPEKAEKAELLAKKHSLPDVSKLLRTLNQARKSVSYDDVGFPGGLDAEDVAAEIEAFVDAVEALVS